MGLKYVGGMILEFSTPRRHPQYMHPNGTNPQFKKKFEKQNFFLQFFKKSKGLECAIWLHAWGGHSGMLKTHL